MMDDIEKLIEESRGMMRKRRLEVINLQTYGFITQKQADEIFRRIEDYHTPIIKKLWDKRNAQYKTQ